MFDRILLIIRFRPASKFRGFLTGQLRSPCILLTHTKIIFGASFSSFGTATLVGYGLINYRWVFSAECRCQRHVKPHNLEDQWLERSNSLHQVSLTSKSTRANPIIGRWNYGREIAENFAENGGFHVTFGFFTCRKFTTWDWRLYFPSEGRRAEDFFARKIRRFRPGLNPWTLVPKASTIFDAAHWTVARREILTHPALAS